MDQISIVVENEEHVGIRIDKFLADVLPSFTRERIKNLVKTGSITHINGDVIKKLSAKTTLNEAFNMITPPTQDATPLAENIPLDIVYEDQDLVVVNKPVGMVVHPAPGNDTGTLVNALLYHCKSSLSGINGIARPGIVHRIDKNTSGLLVVAKNDHAHNFLAKQFADHSIDRAYKAFVWGVPSPITGTIESHIGRHHKDRKKMAVVDEDYGKHAITHYSVEEIYGLGASLVECRLETGRTHQIRVHMSHINHGLLSDTTYTKRKRHSMKLSEAQIIAIQNLERQALHACELGFDHPTQEDRMFFTSELPEDLRNLQQILKTANIKTF